MTDHNTRNTTNTTGTVLVEHQDYYLEGTAIVFTAAYHLRRGYCCGNGCRHCPYEHQAVAPTSLMNKS